MSLATEFQVNNILFTFKKYPAGEQEVLYVSSEIRKVLESGEKFYEESFFQKLFPSLPKPYFDFLFDVLGKGDKISCPLVWKERYFQEVQIEGYVISQEDRSYLCNVLISPLPIDRRVKYAWLMAKKENKFYSSEGSILPFHTILEWTKYFLEKFDFIKEHEFRDFILNPNEEYLTLFPDHLYLTKKPLGHSYCLVQLEYGPLTIVKSGLRNRQKSQGKTLSNLIYYEYDKETKKLAFNGEIEDILGYPLSSFKNLELEKWIALIHPSDRFHFDEGLKRDEKRVYRVKHESGHYVYLQDDRKDFGSEKKGHVFGVIGDITALKAIENDIQSHKSILDQLTGVVPGMVYMVKAYSDGRREFLFVSEGSKQLWERSPKEILENDQTLNDLIHQEDLNYVQQADEMAFLKDQKFEVNFRILTPSGKLKWIYGASDRMRQYENESIWAGFFVDVTYTKEKETEAVLNLNKYKVLFDENPLAIFQYNKEGGIIGVNRAFLEKVNLGQASDLVGKNLFDIVGDDPIAKAYQKSIDEGFGSYEGPYVSRFNQNLFYVRVTAKQVSEEGLFQAIIEDIGEVQYISNTLSGLTEKTSKYSGKEFFDELTAYLSKTLNMNHCFIAEIDDNGEVAKVLSYNSFGKKSKTFQYQLEGTPCFDCLDSGAPYILSKGAHLKYPQDKGLSKMGISTYLGVPIMDNEKNRLGILVLMDEMDRPDSNSLGSLLTIVSDRVGAELERIYFERQLTTSELLYRSIAENFPNGIIDILDQDLICIYTEGKEYENLDEDSKSLIGKSHLDLYEKGTAKEVKSKLKQVFKGQQMVFEITNKDQFYLKNGVPLINDKGKIDRILVVTQNITETKRAESERERLIRDLKSQNEELQRFAYIISHNLRAPIVNITSLLDLYNTNVPSDPENEEVIQNLKASTHILNGTLEDLIEVVSIKKNKLPKIESVNFKKLLRNILRSLSKQVKESGAIIETDFSEAPKINYIYSHLENFFINLCTNAIKYAHPDRTPLIQIKTFEENGFTVIQFKDNGIGIDLNRYQDRLFGLYQRFHSHVDGKGLGLYLVREQIRAHDGNIKIESKLNEGTTFYIYLKNLTAAPKD